jgi:hypothetical protein
VPKKAPVPVIPSEARSGLRAPVESTGLQKPENLLFANFKEKADSSGTTRLGIIAGWFFFVAAEAKIGTP